MGGAE